MSFECIASVRFVIAKATFKLFLVAMFQLMWRKMVLSHKGHVTIVTFERSLSSVFSNVSLQLGGTNKHFVTNITLMVSSRWRLLDFATFGTSGHNGRWWRTRARFWFGLLIGLAATGTRTEWSHTSDWLFNGSCWLARWWLVSRIGDRRLAGYGLIRW